MSGLETAIRNALERSERGDKEVRSRIYQSARQALDAGLRKQNVTDQLVIMQQRKRLEDKIRDIENEEVDRLVASPDTSASPEVSPPRPTETASQTASEAPPQAPGPTAPVPNYNQNWQPASQSGWGTISTAIPAREAAEPAVEPAVAVDAPVDTRRQADLGASLALGGVTRAEDTNANAVAPEIDLEQQPRSVVSDAVAAGAPAASDRRSRRSRSAGKAARAALTDPAEPAAKPRRRRSFLSHLMTWMITLAVVAVGCWLFYRSGMVQSIMDEAMQAADRANTVQPSGQGPSALASRGGFSEEWAPIFEPTEGTAFSAGPQAQAQIAAAPEGQALELASASTDAAGDVAIEVPADILRQLAGRSSTLALTIQSAVNEPAQLSVQCDFGSLGTCRRHRFTATQEKLDALFRVTFDSKLAPNAPGRLILNTGVGGAQRPVLIYSVRALPGQ